ncbi:MAG: hypothetical protein AAGA00_03315 [Pseudomonadota bacterium]
MRIVSVLIVVLFSAWATAAQAQNPAPDAGVQAVVPLELAASEVDDDVKEAIEDAEEAVEDAGKAAVDKAEDARKELQGMVEKSRKNVEQLANDIHKSTGISGRQAFGIAAGMVAGAVVADMMGGGGIVTIAVIAGGGALGSWIMSE